MHSYKRGFALASVMLCSAAACGRGSTSPAAPLDTAGHDSATRPAPSAATPAGNTVALRLDDTGLVPIPVDVPPDADAIRRLVPGFEAWLGSAPTDRPFRSIELGRVGGDRARSSATLDFLAGHLYEIRVYDEGIVGPGGLHVGSSRRSLAAARFECFMNRAEEDEVDCLPRGAAHVACAFDQHQTRVAFLVWRAESLDRSTPAPGTDPASDASGRESGDHAIDARGLGRS